ncbi:carboxypeptidase-like regulatory domain-containing protein [Candidatus Kapabacteria bacterium]|nr:carboxypeptidase-like regulatory domain-containing protein [Candidatus Kapabacteria bacterium]
MSKLFILLVFLTSISNSNSKMIHGNVYGFDSDGNKSELAGVQVWWLGTELGGISNDSGHFMFDLHPNSNTLVFQIKGYPNDTLVVDDKNKFIEHILKTYSSGKDVIVEAIEPNRIINSESIQNEEILTGRHLGKLACCNLSEAFESDPSVNVEYTDPVSGSKQIKLMGLHGKYSQIMIEKISFVRGLNIPFGLSYLPGPWIESISISKGAADVSTGFESTTGQINVELKKPNSEISDGLINLFLDAGNRLELNSVFNKKIDDRVSMVSMFNINIIPNLNDLNNDGLIDRPATRSMNFSNKFKFEGNTAKAQVGIRFLIDERESEYITNSFNSNFDISNTRGELFFKGGDLLGENYSVGITGSLSWQENNTNNLLGKIHNEFNLTNNSAQINLIVDRTLDGVNDNSKNVLSFGASLLYDDFSNEIISDIETVNKFSYITPGIFVSYKNMSFKYIDFSLGLRADYNYLDQVFVTPRSHIKIKPLDNLDLRISGGRGLRYANALAENVFLFLYDENANYLSLVNFEQQAMESAWNYGATLNYSFSLGLENISFSAEYFMTDFNNRVVIDQYRYGGVYSPVIYETSNAYSESYGVDLILPFTDFVEISTSGRIQNSFFENQNSKLIREPLSSIVKSVNTVNYDIKSIDLSLRFTGTYFGQGKRTVLRENSDTFQNYNPFWIFGGQINKNFEKQGFEIYFGINNLTSYTIFEDSADSQAIAGNYFGTDLWGPLMGRNIYIGINWKGL